MAGHVDRRRRKTFAEGDWLTERVAGWPFTWREYLLEAGAAECAAAMGRHENPGRPRKQKETPARSRPRAKK